MNLAEMKRKYAYTLAKVGLNVQKGQPVLVEATIKGAEFTPILPRNVINWVLPM